MSDDNENNESDGTNLDFHMFASKGLFDTAFCERIIADPEGALNELGIEPSEEILEALKDIDVESIKRLATAFGSVSSFAT